MVGIRGILEAVLVGCRWLLAPFLADRVSGAHHAEQEREQQR